VEELKNGTELHKTHHIVGQYMYFVHKITALLAIHNILKSFVPNCGMWADQTEYDFQSILKGPEEQLISAFLHTIEGFIEREVCEVYKLSSVAVETIINDTGTPAGWYPLITGYDALPTLPADHALLSLPQELLDYLTAHERITPADKELASIKADLRILYEAGSGAKNVEQEETGEPPEDSGSEEEIASGAYVPIPTETFLEELSVKMQLHPISIYWLLEELKAEGARCKSEELRVVAHLSRMACSVL